MFPEECGRDKNENKNKSSQTSSPFFLLKPRITFRGPEEQSRPKFEPVQSESMRSGVREMSLKGMEDLKHSVDDFLATPADRDQSTIPASGSVPAQGLIPHVYAKDRKVRTLPAILHLPIDAGSAYSQRAVPAEWACIPPGMTLDGVSVHPRTESHEDRSLGYASSALKAAFELASSNSDLPITESAMITIGNELEKFSAVLSEEISFRRISDTESALQ